MHRDVKKPAYLAARGLNPILRGDELEGEELQNIHLPPAPLSFLHAVTFAVKFYQLIKHLRADGNFLLRSSVLCQHELCPSRQYGIWRTDAKLCRFMTCGKVPLIIDLAEVHSLPGCRLHEHNKQGVIDSHACPSNPLNNHQAHKKENCYAVKKSTFNARHLHSHCPISYDMAFSTNGVGSITFSRLYLQTPRGSAPRNGGLDFLCNFQVRSTRIP